MTEEENKVKWVTFEIHLSDGSSRKLHTDAEKDIRYVLDMFNFVEDPK